MKFYEDKVYIDMCRKAEEIQGLWEPKGGDYVAWSDNRYEILPKRCFQKEDWTPTYYECRDGDKWTPKELKADSYSVWLPRQGQLLEMMPHDGCLQKLGMIFHESVIIGTEQPDIYKTIEQYLLAIIMKFKFGKTWNGSEWV